MENLIEENYKMKDEVLTLTSQLNALKSKIANNELLMREHLISNGLVEEECGNNILRLKQSKVSSVNIVDAKKVPEQFLRTKKEPNKVLIKEFLKDGGECDFAELTFSEPKIEYGRI